MLPAMPSLWKFAGLTPLKLAQQAIQKLGEDELSTRSSSLAYYLLLSIFPMLLFLVSLVGLVMGSHSDLQDALVSRLGSLLPGSAADLIHNVLQQTVKSSGGLKLAAGILGSLWAASGGVGALFGSLNVVNRVKETRSWLRLRLTSVGLSLALSCLFIVAVSLIFYGGAIAGVVARDFGQGHIFQLAWRGLGWVVSLAFMFLSFSLVYYYGPNLEERKWYWQTPGAALGVCLWLVSSLGFRVYLHFFDSYSATYGFIGAVIILILWLYMSGMAVLIGAEVNSVIEFAGKHAEEFSLQKRKLQQQATAA
jgi:membrane protein